MINVYVAGKPINRRDLPRIEGIIWLEPYIYNDDIGEKDADVYVPRDLMLVNRADIVILLIETGKELNTFVEAGIAYARGKPIMAVIDPSLNEQTRFLVSVCTSIFTNKQDLFYALEIIGREEFEVRKQELRHEGVINKDFELPPRR